MTWTGWIARAWLTLLKKADKVTDSLPVVRTVADLRAKVTEARSAGKKIGLVPTMGALHHGHLSLVDIVAKSTDFVVVSIFVNPTQFGEGEDFDAYPRDEDTDLNKLSSTVADLVFIPEVSEMYPEGDASKVTISGISDRFEGEHRPGHFDGVATVVSKLFMQCLPDAAVFGEKDYQQLAVVRQFVRDLNMPVEVIGAPIVREADGLAASSRNVYLDRSEREIAGQFNVILKKLVSDVQNGATPHDAEDAAAHALLEAGFHAVDYVKIVDPVTLVPLEKFSGIARVIAVARLGKVRLLDNMAIGTPS